MSRKLDWQTAFSSPIFFRSAVSLFFSFVLGAVSCDCFAQSLESGTPENQSPENQSPGSDVFLADVSSGDTGVAAIDGPWATAGSGVPSQDEANPIFEADIRPIFREHCLDCHGATSELAGELDLRLVHLMKTGGDSGPAIVPGLLDESILWERVVSGEMPPGQARLTDEQLELLKRWIQAGCPTGREEPESLPPGIPITLEERSYWAYQPLIQFDRLAKDFLRRNHRFTEAPSGQDDLSAGPFLRTGLDAVIAGRMPDGLRFSPDASRPTLIRRLFYHLHGISPTESQMEFWRLHPASDWYEQLVDHLLASPQYGERWARHWLDAVGYADSDGFTVADAERPWAWQYRDYVIRSLNEDKSFDRFITEQLSGDELAGPREGDWTEQQIELLSATGMLRLAADGTGSGDNSPEARNKTIADTLQIMGSVLLGSSLHCAQCHDHRYDPISHRDYFALRAVLEPALDWKNWKTPAERLVSLATLADQQVVAELEQQVQEVVAEKATRQQEYMHQALEQELAKFDEALRESLRSAYRTPSDQRNAEQKRLLDSHPSVNITPGVLYQYLPEAAEQLKTYDAKIAEIRSQQPTHSMLHALVEPPGQLPTTRIFHRGDHNQLGDTVDPGGLSVLAPDGISAEFLNNRPELSTSGRRLALAGWLTRSQEPNPLFARAMVNRVWLHHFGRGIVDTPGDFGRLGSQPTHPEVLDWLAGYWISGGWSLKNLHRLIVGSSVFRQDSIRHARGHEADPENNCYWRRDIVRIDAETLRDSMLNVTGQIDLQLYGPPLPLHEDETGQIAIHPDFRRRSVYSQWRRSQPVALLESFDAPVMDVHCTARSVTTTTGQALLLMNNQFLLDNASTIAERIFREAMVSLSEKSNQQEMVSCIERAWKIIYLRLPNEEELSAALEFAEEQLQWLATHPSQLPEGVSAEMQVLKNICQALLSSNEFLYIE
jgi:mono/diheme cytochrome c family protein